MPTATSLARTAWHHLWLGWAFTLVFSWASLVHAGLAARRRDWLAFGALYAVAPASLMLTNGSDVLGILTLLSGLVAFIHAWTLRPAYVAAMLEAEPVATPAIPAAAQLALPPGRVDVNNAPALALAALPGVGVVGAELALRLRAERGGFRSEDDFADALALPAELATQVRQLVAIAPLRPETLAAWSRERATR